MGCAAAMINDAMLLSLLSDVGQSSPGHVRRDAGRKAGARSPFATGPEYGSLLLRVWGPTVTVTDIDVMS
jgi:hypothetical protein